MEHQAQPHRIRRDVFVAVILIVSYSHALPFRDNMNKHDHYRDETETGLHLTRKAPDITAVRSFSKEVRMAPDVQFSREHQPVVRRARYGHQSAPT